MNELTQKLFDAGYTKDDHPEYVKWSHWQDFEYTRDFLKNVIWETPCGLQQKGTGDYNHGSHMGVTYCPENNNPRYGCPYYDEVDCPHRFKTNGMWGWNCAYHMSDKSYDYEMSVEKIWNQWDEIQYKSRMEATEGAYCACMKWDRYNRRYKPEYDVDECIQARCGNEVCVITKRNRNLEKVNIFYDILRTYKTRNGFLEITDRKLEKGIKQFEHQISRTDAEMWLKTRKNKEFKHKLSLDDRKNLYFARYHGLNFTVEVQNIRIEKRESRDLLQDLRDAQEGFEVTHASDNEKKKKQDKHERRVKYQDDKKRRMDKKNVEKWKRLIMDDDFAKQYSKENGISIKSLRDLSESELKKRGIILQETKQLSMF